MLFGFMYGQIMFSFFCIGMGGKKCIQVAWFFKIWITYLKRAAVETIALKNHITEQHVFDLMYGQIMMVVLQWHVRSIFHVAWFRLNHLTLFFKKKPNVHSSASAQKLCWPLATKCISVSAQNIFGYSQTQLASSRTHYYNTICFLLQKNAYYLTPL